MALGEQEDFRSKGFQQVNRFPGQDHIGGTGSPMLQQWTQPSGSTNMSLPVPPLAVPGLTLPNITFPGITLPNQLPPVVLGAGGSTGTSSINVYGGTGTPTPTPVSTIEFIGSGLVNVVVTGTDATVEYQDTGGGGGGSTLVYGYINTASPTRITAGIAAWTYDVMTSGGSAIVARNLLEKGNTSTVAYGYSISPSGSDKISGTSYYVYPVPLNTWVRMEQTSAVDGTMRYWFSAPNFINGSC
jgi:hypothetical protein